MTKYVKNMPEEVNMYSDLNYEENVEALTEFVYQTIGEMQKLEEEDDTARLYCYDIVIELNGSKFRLPCNAPAYNGLLGMLEFIADEM